MQNMSGFDTKDCLTEASLGRRCFATYNKDRGFYAFDGKYVTEFIRKSIKSGRVPTLNSYFESNQNDKLLYVTKSIFKKVIRKFETKSMKI